MKRINALTIAGTDPVVVRGFRPILKPSRHLALMVAQLLLHWWRKIPVAYSRCIALSLILSPPSSIRCSAMCESTPLKSVCWRKPILLKRWQNGCNVIRSKTWYSTPLCWQKRRPAAFTFGGCYAAQSIIATGFINNAKLARSCRLARRATRAHRTGNAGTRAIAVGDGLWRSANERWSSG